VFLHPLLDLREQVLGHGGGAGLAPLSEGDVVGLVQWAAVMAPAGRLAATFVQQDKARGQHGASRGQRLQPTVQHAADQCGVARYTHRAALGHPVLDILHRKRPKKPGCEEKN
jgi:hypothetical protein